MNLKMLKRDVGYLIRLLPTVIYCDADGIPTGAPDGHWTITSVGHDGVTITSQSGINCRLSTDHVYRFVTDLVLPDDTSTRGFLQLHVQIVIRGTEVSVVPNHQPGAPVDVPEIAATRARSLYAPEIQRTMRGLVYVLDRTIVNFSVTGNIMVGIQQPISPGDTWQSLKFSHPQKIASSPAYKDLAGDDIEMLAEFYGAATDVAGILEEWSERVPLTDYNHWNVFMHKVEHALKRGDFVIRKFCSDCPFDAMIPVAGNMLTRTRKSLDQASKVRSTHIERMNAHFNATASSRTR